jgi:MFS family permease
MAQIFRSRNWRWSAFGYFGHMWELYTFWAFVPVMIELYVKKTAGALNIPLFSFLVIAAGSLSCVAGGYLSQRFSSAKVAAANLLISGICCLLSPLIFSLPLVLFLFFLFAWSLTVIPDSPQFSTLVAQYAPAELRGTALTIYNSIGFSISVVSLFVIDRIFHSTGFFGGERTFLLLGIGAITGLPYMFRLLRTIKSK